MGTKLYVSNLNFRTTEEALAAAFAERGLSPTSVKVIKDHETGRSRGFAFVDMASEADAQKALQTLNDHAVEGRPLKITEARPPRAFGSAPPGGPRSAPFDRAMRDEGSRSGAFSPRQPREAREEWSVSVSREEPWAVRRPGFGGPARPGPAEGAPFDADAPRDGRRDRKERRDLSKQHSRRDRDEGFDEDDE